MRNGLAGEIQQGLFCGDKELEELPSSKPIFAAPLWAIIAASSMQTLILFPYAKTKISTGVKILLLTGNIGLERIQAQHAKKHKNVKILITSSQPSKVKRLSPLNPTSAAMPSLMWFNAPKQKNE